MLEQPSKVILCLSQALDLWAMGVTLYCFVFGKASVHSLLHNQQQRPER